MSDALKPPFPIGASLSAYPESAFQPGKSPSAAPPVAATEAGIVVAADGSATFLTLVAGTRYRIGYDTGGGVWRYVNFLAGASQSQATRQKTTLGLSPGAAYTQTYATAARTNPNPTAAAVSAAAATNVAPYGFAQAQADAIVASVNALVADVAAVKKLLNSVIDDLQAQGLAQ